MISKNLKIEEDKALAELKDNLNSAFGDRIISLKLFGSRARGDYDRDSDIDIAVIVRGLTREFKKQIFEIIAELELKYLTPLSVVVFSEDEFNHLKKRERRIAIDIEREGISL